NGSLYVAQNNKLRRLTPLECERLMGIPDNYTLVNGNSDTNRYQAIGNSWAVPVIEWIGRNLDKYDELINQSKEIDWKTRIGRSKNNLNANLFLLNKVVQISQSCFLNSSTAPNNPIDSNIQDI